MPAITMLIFSPLDPVDAPTACTISALRHDDRAQPRPSGAQRELRVLAVEEEPLVHSAEPVPLLAS